MNDKVRTRELSLYRLQQANESLSEMDMLKNAGYIRGAINRAYYAMFYAIQALVVQKKANISKTDYESFIKDSKNLAAAESYLRRALEALLDLGRHVLAKGFGIVVAEYKEIGVKLAEQGVLDEHGRQLMRQMAG